MNSPCFNTQQFITFGILYVVYRDKFLNAFNLIKTFMIAVVVLWIAYSTLFMLPITKINFMALQAATKGESINLSNLADTVVSHYNEVLTLHQTPHLTMAETCAKVASLDGTDLPCKPWSSTFERFLEAFLLYVKDLSLLVYEPENCLGSAWIANRMHVLVGSSRPKLVQQIKNIQIGFPNLENIKPQQNQFDIILADTRIIKNNDQVNDLLKLIRSGGMLIVQYKDPSIKDFGSYQQAHIKKLTLYSKKPEAYLWIKE